MDTYRGVALGVESAWPDFVYGNQEAVVERSKVRALPDLTEYRLNRGRLFHSIPNTA